MKTAMGATHSPRLKPERACSTPKSKRKRTSGVSETGSKVEASPNFQALFQDLPDLTPPRKKMSYSSFPGQSPSSGGEFGFPRLSGTPDRQRLGIDFLQRPSSGTLNSPHSFVSPRAVLGLPPLPIFQPSPIRASQANTYVSPESKGKRRQSDVSELQRFSMSPGYQGLASNAPKGLVLPLVEGKNCLTSAFADILDGHSRVSPKHFTVKAGPKSDKKDFSGSFWKDDMIPLDLNNASNSPLQLKKEVSMSQKSEAEKARNQNRKSLDFSDIHLSPEKGQSNTRIYPQSPGLTSHVIDNVLPIHPLENGSREISPEGSGQMYSYTHSQLGLNTSTQSPMGAKIGLIRREDIIDSPAVKEATDAAVAAAMRANSFISSMTESRVGLKRPQRAAAAGAAAAAAAAAASGTMKGKRSNTYNTSSIAANRSDDAIFLSASIPGMTMTAPTKCKCKKSKCLKLYCECFKARGYCGHDCSCDGCSNKPGCDEDIENAREIILTRNPQAFAGKIAETVVPSQDGLLTSGAQHAKGCNCKKSKCQKKYCECFQAGVPCGEHCKCNGCANTAQHHDITCSKQSSMTGLVQQGRATASMSDSLFRSLGQRHSKNIEDMRKIVQQSIKSDVSSTLIPVCWTGVEESSDGNFPGRAEVIHGLTPIAPQNLEIKTETSKKN